MTCLPPWSTSVLRAGAHAVAVRATDTAGNVGKPARFALTARRDGR